MEALVKDCDVKKDLDDSGCVQDVGPPPQQTEFEEEELGPPELMDFSDDVLLNILRFCSPMDLKALGFACARLGRLVRDRSLWRRVDARGARTGRARLRWLLAHALGPDTTELLLRGYAEEARGCLGHVNRKRKEVEEEKAQVLKAKEGGSTPEGDVGSGSGSAPPGEGASTSRPSRGGPEYQIMSMDTFITRPWTRFHHLSRQSANGQYFHPPRSFSGTPSWPEEAPHEEGSGAPLLDGSCPGPQFTLTQCMLRQLRTHCALTSLALEYCNVNCNTLSRSFSGTPSWPEEAPHEEGSGAPLLDGSCPGPQFTLTQCMLRQLRTHCALTSLALEYCNVNCNTTGIAHFPPTLKKLSLKGAKCYNLPLDKSFLFNIQDYLPQLEHLDLSECEWLEPASLLPLSKVGPLRTLVARDCSRLSEFVAYASLATRYGFRNLEILDLRGSPVADSEVSALGWLPSLQELYLSPAGPRAPRPRDHAHYRDEPLPAHRDLQPWEMEEPEYFKIKPQIVEPLDSRSDITIDDIEEHIEQLRDYENNICLHGTEYNLCMEGISQNAPRKRPAEPAETTPVPPKKEMLEPTNEENPEKPDKGSNKSGSDVVINIGESSSGGGSGTKADDTKVRVISLSEYNTERPALIENGKQSPESSKQDDREIPSSSTDVKERPISDKERPIAMKGEGKSNDSKEVPSEGKESKEDNKKDSYAESADCKVKSAKDSEKPSNSCFVREKRSKIGMDEDDSKNSKKEANPADSKNNSKPADLKKDPKLDSKDEPNETDANNEKNPVDPMEEMKSVWTRYGIELFRRRRAEDPEAGPSTKKKKSNHDDPNDPKLNKDDKIDEDASSDDDDDDDMPDDETPKEKVKGTETSKSTTNGEEGSDKGDGDEADDENTKKEPCKEPEDHPRGCQCLNRPPTPPTPPPPRPAFEYVRFRQNMEPVLVPGPGNSRDPVPIPVPIPMERERDGNEGEARPRAHVLYVNVGQQLHTVYRLSIQNDTPLFYSFAGNNHLRFRPNVGNVFYTPPTPHLDAASLVSDSAIRRFGRADVDDVNYIHIGPRGGPGDQGARPNRSSLRILSVTGFSNITDRSLVHLATAAPELRFIDFSQTNVSAQGVENFRSLRPECEVIFSQFVSKEEEK